MRALDRNYGCLALRSVAPPRPESPVPGHRIPPQVRDVFDGVFAIGPCPPRSREDCAGYGGRHETRAGALSASSKAGREHAAATRSQRSLQGRARAGDGEARTETVPLVF